MRRVVNLLRHVQVLQGGLEEGCRGRHFASTRSTTRNYQRLLRSLLGRSVEF